MRDRHYWLRLTRLFAAALLVTLVILPVGLGGLMMWSIMHSGCGRSGSPDSHGLAYEAVEFPSLAGFMLRGFFMPGTNGGTVIIVAPIGGDSGADLPDAAIFNRAGFNVLTVESRSCAGAPFHSLGYLEADDAEGAYRYLLTRDDVDAERISIHGFSSGGSTSLFTIARVPELRAVSAKGGYHDFAEQLGLGRHDNILNFLIRSGADVTYRLMTGLDVRVLSPINAIDDITPRPILLVYGSREVSLPGARLMFQRASEGGGSADLYIVEGAGHGNYLAKGGAEYERRLVDFHRAALLGG